MRPQLRGLAIVAVAALALPTLSAFAARPERKVGHDSVKVEETRTGRSATRVNRGALPDLHAVPLKSADSAKLSVARTMLKTLGGSARSSDSARVVSYAFGVEAGQLGRASAGGHAPKLTASALKAIDHLSPREAAQLLKTRGVDRSDAVEVLNRIERLKTDPTFLSGPEASAKVKSLLADHDQGLSETQLARNEDLADEVYGVQ